MFSRVSIETICRRYSHSLEYGADESVKLDPRAVLPASGSNNVMAYLRPCHRSIIAQDWQVWLVLMIARGLNAGGLYASLAGDLGV